MPKPLGCGYRPSQENAGSLRIKAAEINASDGGSKGVYRYKNVGWTVSRASKGGLEVEPPAGFRVHGHWSGVTLPEAEGFLVLVQWVSTEKWLKA